MSTFVRRPVASISIVLALFLFAGCPDAISTANTAPENNDPIQENPLPEEEPEPTPGSLIVLEAETAELISANGNLYGDPVIHEDHVSIKQVGGISWTLTVPERSRFNLVLVARAMDAPKTNDVKVDGSLITSFTISEAGEWLEEANIPLTLDAGSHTIEIVASWGWIDVDRIELRPPLDTAVYYQVDAQLANPNAADAAQRLMAFITDNYGEKIIAGQMDLAWDESVDMAARVYALTGKYPALMGFDFMNIRQPAWDGGGSRQTAEAIAWGAGSYAGSGIKGIVSICWHWRVPQSGSSRGEDEAFYSDETAFRIPLNSDGTIDTGSIEYTAVIQPDLDLVAAQLGQLEDAGIPVLWRPLHEAAGTWFWWGASGPAAFKALWIHLYEYFTDTMGLDNLIWVWNGQAVDWYPGDGYVDIIGQDMYPGARQYGSQAGSWFENVQYSDDPVAAPKPVALTENGAIPDPDRCLEDGALWSWFMTWNDGAQDGDDENNFWTGEYHNEDSHKRHVYNHETVITLDELPDFSNYQY